MAKVEAKIHGRKRGILFTVSVLLLAISLIGMAIALSEQSAKAKYMAVGAIEIDRVSDTYANIVDQLDRILSANTNISTSGNYAIVNESLPNDPEFTVNVDRFVGFELNFSDLNTNISLSVPNLKNGTFMVQPNNIVITHPANGFAITPQNSPASSGAVSSYDVNVTYGTQNVDGAVWVSLASVANGSANSEMVHVRVADSSFTFLQDYYYTLDKSSPSLLNMTQGGVLVGTILFKSPAALQVNYTGNIGLKASIGLTNPVYVETNDTISVVASANKTGRLRIS